MCSTRSEIRSRLLVAFAMATLLALATLAPFEAADGNDAFYALFRGVCHQKAERCVQLFGYPMAICARCVAIYLGVATGALALPLWNERHRRKWLMALGLSAGLIALDASLDAIGVYDNLFPTRVVTGFLAGLPLGAMGATALKELLERRATPSKAN